MSNHVEETNDQSAASKLSMVEQGYFSDPYMKYFCPKFKRRSPLVNMCYFVRAFVMNEGIHTFLNYVKDSPAQIVSFGAGFDTTYFRLISKLKNIVYFEVDLANVVRKKIEYIKMSDDLQQILGHLEEFEYGLMSPNYHLISQDLRDVTGLKNVLKQSGLDEEKLTLIISECALVYLDVDKSNTVLEVYSKLPNALLLLYEQINPDDGFGTVMVNHFINTGHPLKSLDSYKTLNHQVVRLKSLRYGQCFSIGVANIFKTTVTSEELDRIVNLEPFDEWEEWHLTCSHYSLTLGTKGLFVTPAFEFFRKFYEESNDFDTKLVVNMEVVEIEGLQLYAHSCELIWNSTACLIIGGFGTDPEVGHRRLTQIRILSIYDSKVSYLMPPSIDGVTWDCLHHSCTLMSDSQDESVLLLFGGRTSPHKEVNDIPVIVTVSRASGYISIKAEKFPVTGPMPPSRKRHTATSIFGNVWIYGGIHYDPEEEKQKVLSDIWIFSKDRTVRKLDTDAPPRFSHSAAGVHDLIYFSGGMDENFQPSFDILLYNTTTGLWRDFTRRMPPRYSHSSHIIGGNLYMVGGVSDHTETQPGVVSIDIRRNITKEYKLPKSTKSSPLMIHNHCSFVFGHQIFVVGGGGNCFTFGTSFNSALIMIDLNFSNLRYEPEEIRLYTPDFQRDDPFEYEFHKQRFGNHSLERRYRSSSSSSSSSSS